MNSNYIQENEQLGPRENEPVATEYLLNDPNDPNDPMVLCIT